MTDFFQHWKNYLLLLTSISYIAGLAFHPLLFFIPTTVQLFSVTLVSIIFLLIFGGNKTQSACILISVFFIFGMYQGNRSAIDRVDNNHIAAQLSELQDAVLIGTLTEMVTVHNDISRAMMSVSYLRPQPSAAYQPATGTIVLNLKGVWPETILPGDSFIVRAAVRAPPVTNVPGTFNYRKYLAGKNIFLSGFVRSPVLIQPVSQLPAGTIQQPKHALERVRFHVGQRLDEALPEASGALYRALLIGDRSHIEDELYETLKRAGILHILAISGMHLGLLAILSSAVVYWLMRRSEKLLLCIDARKYSLILTLPLLLFYAFLAGFQPPVVRSLIMTGCLVIGYAVNRLQSPLTTLGCTALVILLFDPPALMSAAFQLSFSAVASIILLTPPLLTLMLKTVCTNSVMGDRVLKIIFTLLSVTIAASIGTLPLMLLHFNRFSAVGIIANLLIEPIICLFSLPLGFFSLPCMYLSQPLAELILHLGAFGLDLSVEIASFLTAPDFTQIWLPAPGLLLVFFYYFSLALILFTRRSLTWSLLCMTGFIATLVCFNLPVSGLTRTGLDSTRISILDVGHGSANVIELTSGRVILVDGGAKSRPGYDCGERLIAPFLWSRRIGRIDDIILTHDDADHYNGAAAVIERFKPDRLFIPADNSPKEGFARLIAYARNSGVEIITPEPGKIIDDGDETLSILGSYTEDLNAQVSGFRDHALADDNGLVIKLRSKNTTMLFPGDITKKRERKLAANSRYLKAEILLSPHHGSSTSNSYEFLEAVAPEVIIFSNGKNRSDLFPAKETTERVNLLGIAALETAAEGTITITVDSGRSSPPGYRISTYNITSLNYWKRS